VRASYAVSDILAKYIKPFGEGEIIKECKRQLLMLHFLTKYIISRTNLTTLEE
jgi:hypothetical protein